jgi:hypothetical protein
VLAALEPLLEAERAAIRDLSEAAAAAERRCRSIAGPTAWMAALSAVRMLAGAARERAGETLASRVAELDGLPAGVGELASAVAAHERDEAAGIAARALAVRELAARRPLSVPWPGADRRQLRAALAELDDAIAGVLDDARLRYELVAALAPRASC